MATFAASSVFVAEVEVVDTASEGVVFVRVTALMSANAPTHTIHEAQWDFALRTAPTDCDSELEVVNSVLALSFVGQQQCLLKFLTNSARPTSRTPATTDVPLTPDMLVITSADSLKIEKSLQRSHSFHRHACTNVHKHVGTHMCHFCILRPATMMNCGRLEPCLPIHLEFSDRLGRILH